MTVNASPSVASKDCATRKWNCMAIWNLYKFVEANNKWKFELAISKVKDFARRFDHCRSIIENQNKRATISDNTQRFVGGVEYQCAVHHYLGSNAWLALIGL
jgi:hypothetical protein